MDTLIRHRPHRPKVRRELRDHGLRWQYRCTCGTAGPEQCKRAEALADQQAHLLAVAAPEPQRCQQPRTHGAAWWDACQLCAAQMSLF